MFAIHTVSCTAFRPLRFRARCVLLFFLCSLRLRCRKPQVPTSMIHATTCSLLTYAAIPSELLSSKRAVGNWDDAHAKATAALAKLSQSEKIGIVTGVGWQNGNCVGNTKPAASIGYPSLCLQGKQICLTTFEPTRGLWHRSQDAVTLRICCVQRLRCLELGAWPGHVEPTFQRLLTACVHSKQGSY